MINLEVYGHNWIRCSHEVTNRQTDRQTGDCSLRKHEEKGLFVRPGLCLSIILERVLQKWNGWS